MNQLSQIERHHYKDASGRRFDIGCFKNYDLDYDELYFINEDNKTSFARFEYTNHDVKVVKATRQIRKDFMALPEDVRNYFIGQTSDKIEDLICRIIQGQAETLDQLRLPF